MTPDDLLKWAMAIGTALTALGPIVALFLRRIRAGWRGEESAALEEVTTQRDALVEGHADVLAKLERESPQTAKLVKQALEDAAKTKGVQSDIEPLADEANKAARDKLRRTTPTIPLVPPVSE